jgi:phage/plasmid-associated DNA primase
MYGPSNLGKTKLVNTVKGAIGAYCVSMDRDCVIGVGAHSEGAATPHLVKLDGAHIAILEETKVEDTYNGSNLKSIASGDGCMTARGLHKNPVEVTMLCLPIICTNALPKFDVTDTGTLKKLRVFPFKREFVEKPQAGTNERLIDLDLAEKI